MDFIRTSSKALISHSAAIRFLLIFFFCVPSLWKVDAAETENTKPTGAVLEFAEAALDMGTLTLADLELFQRKIEFVNSGDQPLILSNVRGCCGTRITDWPRAPLMPGETGQIAAQFRLAARPHTVRRTITVTSNATEPTKVHRITGTVIEGETAAPAAPMIGPQLLFLEERLDMGSLSTDQIAGLEARIDIENQGDQPLVLRTVRGGVRTRVIEWPQDPLPPGERGAILLQLDVEDHPHAFSQHLFIIANTESQRYTYRIHGVVESP